MRQRDIFDVLRNESDKTKRNDTAVRTSRYNKT
jgi:hypothetical protein